MSTALPSATTVRVLPSTHCSPETGYVVHNYPFGYRLRCILRAWIETKKGFGQRFCTQTTQKYFNSTYTDSGACNITDVNDPRYICPPMDSDAHWNNPKHSTYSKLRIMFIDHQGHLCNDGLSGYETVTQLQAFADRYKDIHGKTMLDEPQQHLFQEILAEAIRKNRM